MPHKTENPYNHRRQETVEQHHQSIRIATKALRETEKQEDISFFDDHFTPIVKQLVDLENDIKNLAALCVLSFIMDGAIVLMVFNNG